MAYSEFLSKHMKDKTTVKVFLDNSTMLQGKVTSFNEDFIVIDSCLVNVEHIISIAINNR